MVAMFGMSDEFGMMALASRRTQYLDGGYGMDCAQDTAARMDEAVKKILDRAYKTAVETVRENREDMDKDVTYLLEKETITGAEMLAIIEGRDPSLVENPYASTKQDGFRPSQPEEIEAPAKKIRMISEKIEPPASDASEETPEASDDTQTASDSAETPETSVNLEKPEAPENPQTPDDAETASDSPETSVNLEKPNEE